MRDVGRLNAFTDGVLVVSMTLLVLNIDLPEGLASKTDGQLVDELADLGPKLLGYLLSFLVVAKYWMGYTDRFGDLKKIDERFTWLNILFLLVVGFVPFATALLSENGRAIPVLVYAATMIAASVMLTLMWLHANAAGLLGEPVPSGAVMPAIMPWLQIATVFGLSMLVAPVNADIAKLTWLLLAVPTPKIFGRRQA
jgi:uncharacterized membrane protein